ncbi:MAG TPA: aspartate aminotransferase family protein [Alphaproteobacteria bacterium]|nr:aspartate aminotransferase family protein [Alphaproteobacteria bacterium]
MTGTHVFQRQIAARLPMADHGDGVYIVDADDKRYLDASGGAAVSSLGHSDPCVARAIHEQVDRIAFAHTGYFTSRPAEELADFLSAAAPGDMEAVYYTSGGSEAVEAALKMARQYFLERGEPKRRRFIARRQSYHGNTLGALAVGGNAIRRKPYLPLLMEVSHIAPCYAYRHQKDDETEQEYGLRAAAELEDEIIRLGPETVIGFVAETVAGATLGVVPPVAGYFRRIRDICDKYGVLLILDEVMSGMGRTGTLFACEAEGIAADIFCVAKGLGAGYQPIGAAIAGKAVFEAFRAGSGAFENGHTYMGHPIAAAAALAVQKTIFERNLLDNVRRRGGSLAALLRDRLGDHPFVGDIRGRGLFWGIELVADRRTKEPFDPALSLHARVKAAAFERGLICYPGPGAADGVRGDHILLAPPFIIDEAQIEELVDKLSDAVRAAFTQAGVGPE